MNLNNTASMVALGNLNKNVKKVGTTLAKIASGDRIPTAKYDSAGLAMSEILREQLRSLHQDQQNVQNGSAMFRVASGGIDDIIQNIRRLKELAINSANDSNSDLDRATIQKEVDATLATIEDIAVGTEYNGIKLLDGTYALKKAEQLYDTRTEPTGDPILLTSDIFVNGEYTISEEDKVYKLDSSLDSGAYKIKVTSSNIKFVGGGGATYPNLRFEMQKSASLWFENLTIGEFSGGSVVDFQGEQNFLHLKGNNEIWWPITTWSPQEATIHAGGNLIIVGEKNTGIAGQLIMHINSGQSGATIGSNAYESNNNSNINILSGSISLRRNGALGCALGTGAYASIGNITMYDGSLDILYDQWTPAIGADIGSKCGKIAINGGNITINNPISGQMFNSFSNIKSDSAHSRYLVGGYDSSSTVESVEFNGGKIEINNVFDGKSVAHGAGVPDGNGEFTNDDKTYKLELPNILPPDENSTAVENSNLLAIHHGTKSNQMDLFYIDSMRPKSLGLERLDVTTRDKSTAAIDKIDKALEYALDAATDVGSYMARLEKIESTLEIKSENTALSDSVLRDADMAKEMTEYTKFNVLTQSAQAMLAQAGQNQSQVLSLLQ